jgi:outer membrane protein OmpA-like peptidoglycan-associated protein
LYLNRSEQQNGFLMTRWLWGVVAALVLVGIGVGVWQTGYWSRIAPRPETRNPPPASVAEAPTPAPAPAPPAQSAPTAPAPSAQSTSPSPAPAASSAPPAPAPAASSPPPAPTSAAQSGSPAPAQGTVTQSPAPAPAPAPAEHTAPPAPAAQTPPPAATSTPAGATAEQTNEAASGANGKAIAELAALRPGFSAKTLVAALNDSHIDFASASAEVPASKADLLQRAADEIKRLPLGHVLEVAGYTDNSGNPTKNVVLSRQRAEAVRDALTKDGVNPDMLVAKGYGSADPIASNDTPDDRARNRRIEFHVMKTP